jgi:hypothetical protein
MLITYGPTYIVDCLISIAVNPIFGYSFHAISMLLFYSIQKWPNTTYDFKNIVFGTKFQYTRSNDTIDAFDSSFKPLRTGFLLNSI